MATTAVSLVDFRPSARYDDVPWTKARIEWSAELELEELGSGEAPDWETVETIDLDPVDRCPDRPRARSFTTLEAISPTAWLRIVFLDADDNEDVPSSVAAARDPIFRPTIGQVETILRARTYSDGGEGIGAGGQRGTFGEDTNPTAVDVEHRLIPAACQHVDNCVGRVPGVYLDDARRVAALRTAAEIERSYLPEQAETGTAPIYQTLRMTADELTKELQRNVEAFLHVTRGLL